MFNNLHLNNCLQIAKKKMRGYLVLRQFSAICLLVFMVCSFSLSHAADEISYDINILGIENAEFNENSSTFEEASILKNRSGAPFVSVANLRSNINADVEILEKILRAEGYYNGLVEPQFMRNDNHFSISFQVKPGPVYSYGKIEVIFTGNSVDDEISRNINDALIINEGETARAVPVIISERNIANSLPKYGFSFAGEVDSDIIVDHREQVLNVTFSADPGTRRRMGNVKFEGLSSVKEEYLRKFIIWPKDSYYEQRHVDQLRNRIIESNLFSGVNIDVVPDGEDHADIVINHIEAKHRTIGTSVSRQTKLD
ncbi:hypothetical protein [Pseudemcibacter sp.]|uniref:hypothetical protein n=1 Tax=Pseudemcibacter sp. TaxID=2943293 RepID=UPI003F69E428